MANFTAADIKALREKTGAGMMDVKKALEEANGDAAKAEEILRVKGAKTAAKRADRAASDGTGGSCGNGVRNSRCFFRKGGGRCRHLDGGCDDGNSGHAACHGDSVFLRRDARCRRAFHCHDGMGRHCADRPVGDAFAFEK